jgi:poly(3-hydroxybutyrate) depolymerase
LERVKPSDIRTTALMSVEGELDDISGSGQTRAVHNICTGVPKAKQKHFEAMGAGHYGIFSGRRWREHVYPEVTAFINSHHSTPALKAAPAKKAALVKKVAPAKTVTLAKKAAPAKKTVVAKKTTPAKKAATKR